MSVLLETVLETITATPQINPGLSQYDLKYQIAPIMLSGGIVDQTQGGLVPITEYTGGLPDTVDQAFAIYLPLPGSTLISQSIAMYPFANQAVAANATIQQPLTLSMVMIAPVNQAGGYDAKQSTFSALQSTLQNHNSSGGMYTVATPAFQYENLLLISMTDITGEDYRQKQIQWQFDFIQPLITQQQAQQAQNGLMQRISSGTQLPANSNGALLWSGQPNVSPANLPGVSAALGNVTGQVSNITGNIG